MRRPFLLLFGNDPADGRIGYRHVFSRLFGRRILNGDGLGSGIRHANDARVGNVHAFDPDHMRVVADEVLRNGLGHVFEILTRKTVFLKTVERQFLQLVGASGDFLARQIRLELLEHVLGHRALFQIASQLPSLAQSRNLRA